MSDMHVIGIDHGNAGMKTRSYCFSSGIAEYEHEPFTAKDVLEYDGKYYVCGTGRQPYLRDKTVNNRYYLLTLAAIAKEMNARQIASPADICIAAGLPLTNYGRDINAFSNYLTSKSNPIRFKYEKKNFEINIREVLIFPQAYAALSLHTDMIKGEPSIIVADIGGWTVDLMRIDYGTPDASTCRSLELGMIRCMDEISEQVRRSVGLSVTAAQIESVLKGESCAMNEKARTVIKAEGEKYTERLLSAISESGFDTAAMPIIFMGGGAGLMKNHVAPSFALYRPIIIEDVKVNAKGYERLSGAFGEGFKDG